MDFSFRDAGEGRWVPASFLAIEARSSSLRQPAFDDGAGASRLGVFEEGIPAPANRLLRQQDTLFSSISPLTSAPASLTFIDRSAPSRMETTSSAESLCSHAANATIDSLVLASTFPSIQVQRRRSHRRLCPRRQKPNILTCWSFQETTATRRDPASGQRRSAGWVEGRRWSCRTGASASCRLFTCTRLCVCLRAEDQLSNAGRLQGDVCRGTWSWLLMRVAASWNRGGGG